MYTLQIGTRRRLRLQNLPGLQVWQQQVQGTVLLGGGEHVGADIAIVER